MIPKFRAWDLTARKMHAEGFFIGGEGDLVFDPKVLGKYDPLAFEIMQYTGLRDRNGKEIYEGDIVRDPDNIGIVFWNEFRAMFGIDTSLTDRPSKSKKFTAPFDDWCEWLVIGNVHENPELLEA